MKGLLWMIMVPFFSTAFATTDVGHAVVGCIIKDPQEASLGAGGTPLKIAVFVRLSEFNKSEEELSLPKDKKLKAILQAPDLYSMASGVWAESSDAAKEIFEYPSLLNATAIHTSERRFVVSAHQQTERKTFMGDFTLDVNLNDPGNSTFKMAIKDTDPQDKIDTNETLKAECKLVLFGDALSIN